MSDLPTPVPAADTKVYIPKCCTEGHEDCPHVINNDRREKKKNIAL